jgi:putative zinc finger protein
MQLFKYLAGALDNLAARKVEEHLAACGQCAPVAEFIRDLKSEISNFKFEISGAHPDAGELAALFYNKERPQGRATVAHVALCQSCADELSEYARAERAASAYKPAEAQAGEVPAAAWEMIRDWEESSFARPRTSSDWGSQQELAELSKMLSQRKQELLERARDEIAARSSLREQSDMVPVIIVDAAARFLGVEIFEKTTGPRGASILKHAEKSERFDNKPFHALLDFGTQGPVVLSDLIKRDTVRLQRVTRPDAVLRSADYFIVED